MRACRWCQNRNGKLRDEFAALTQSDEKPGTRVELNDEEICAANP